MDAKDYVVNEVLRDPRRFMVPIYQRRYQWGDAEITPFWNDVVAKADEALEGQVRFHHYMGALILAPGGDGYSVGVTPRIQVVDGQQRLTTFQIFLAALREVAVENGIDDIGPSVSNYLFNQKMSGDTDTLVRFKLSPTPADRSLIHDILDTDRERVRAKYAEYYFQNQNLRWGSAPPALAAYYRLIDHIKVYATYGLGDLESKTIGDEPPAEGQGQEIVGQRLHALLVAVLSHMKLVVITLGEGDDAQVIFETLNSKGRPLLAMDLVKNNIFHRAESQGEVAEGLYTRLWGTFEEPFWEQVAPRARPARPRIDHFLSHALTAQTGAQTSMRELYAEYRAFARPKGKARFERVEDELLALTRYAPAYRVLEGDLIDASPLQWFGAKLRTWEVTTAYPIAFQVADANVDDEQQTSIYRMIYSYIVRRAVCGLTNKNYNGVFQRIGTRFLRDGPSASAFADSFSDQTGSAVRFPSDDEFRSAMFSNPLYNWLSAGRLVDILWEFELASRSRYAEVISRPDDLWIEHIMPKSWDAHWPSESGQMMDRNSVEPTAIRSISERDRLIHTIGNLTITTDILNISIGNKSFADKKVDLQASSYLALNRAVTGRETWGETAIMERGAQLADIALSIWPSPARTPAA